MGIAYTTLTSTVRYKRFGEWMGKRICVESSTTIFEFVPLSP